MVKALQGTAVAAVVVLLLSLAAISYLSSPPSSNPTEQQSTTETKAKMEGEKQHSFGGFIRFMFPDAISIYTAWLVVATVLLGIVAVIQIGFLGRAEIISSNAAKAAKDSADAAKGTVQQMKINAAQQLRAYIFVEKGAVVLDGMRLKAAVDIKNAGQTPAYNVGVKTRMGTEEARKKFAPPPLEDVTVERTIVGPGMVINPQSELVIPPDRADALQGFKDGRGVIYVFGQVEYRDIFDQIWILDFRLQTHTFVGTGWLMGTSDEGNSETQQK